MPMQTLANCFLAGSRLPSAQCCRGVVIQGSVPAACGSGCSVSGAGRATSVSSALPHPSSSRCLRSTQSRCRLFPEATCRLDAPAWAALPDDPRL